MSACAAHPDSAGFIGSVTRFIDCQAEQFATGAWTALSLPGSTLSVVLSGFLTLFIAMIGYNLLLGHGPTVRSGTLAFVKIGVVLALATSWPAYQIVVYDLVTDAPGQLVSEIASRSPLPGTDGTLVRRLDQADGALVQLSILGAGAPVHQAGAVPPPPFAGFESFALGGSRILFLIAAIAGLATVKLIAGLLLALGPLFIAFLLFDSTRGLFEGWVRVLTGAAIGAVGVTIILAFELAMLEPWLSTVLTRRMSGEALPSAPTELFALTVMFAILIAAIIIACARVTRGFRLALPLQRFETSHSGSRPAPGAATATVGAGRHRVVDERSRAAAVADVLVAMQRRDSGRGAALGGHAAGDGSGGAYAAPPDQADGRAGGRSRRSSGRRVRARITASGERRDRN